MRSVQRRRALLHSSRIAAVVGGRTEVTGSVRTEWSGVQPETCNQPDTCDEDKPRRDHKTRLDSVRASTVVYFLVIDESRSATKLRAPGLIGSPRCSVAHLEVTVCRRTSTTWRSAYSTDEAGPMVH